MMEKKEVYEQISHLFGEKSVEKQLVEESDVGAKNSTLEMIKLCNVNHVSEKLGVIRLASVEMNLCQELSQNEVKQLFYSMLEADDFSSLKNAPNGWRSESSSERVCGSQYGKGIED